MKAPVGLLSGRAVCVSRWRGFAPTSSAERSKRIFTGGVMEGNGICSAAFCESAALRGSTPSVIAYGDATFPKGTAFGGGGKLCGSTERRPLGGAVAQRLRGFKSAEPEKTVKRSSRRTGVNLQFFPV